MTELQFDQAKIQMENGGVWLCLRVTEPAPARGFVYGIKPKLYDVEIKEHREKRSLDANAYCWVLLGKLSAVLRIPPEEIYRDAIRDVGDNYEVMPVRNDALERWKRIWTSNGIGWMCEEIGPSKIEGYTNVRNFFGSSTYDKAQMHRLLEIVISECKAQNIDTATPAEIARMEEAWGNA